ncbi:MAG: hypothetical protein HY271_15195 [Deltaproteobacteria bacterium]|nr:hypothetical protein [Deltaproteobacteria bacterium]
MAEFFENDARTEEHILACNESSEIVDLFELWQPHVDRFPGLRKNLRQVCRKGPTLREQENPAASSNRPRNDAFSYLVSGTLLSAAVSVVAVEGLRRTDFAGASDADLTFESSAGYVDVECKRPQTEDGLVPRMREALGQLMQPSRDGRLGVVALDCSTIVRPPGTLLEYKSGEVAEARVSDILAARLGPKLVPHLTAQVLGVVLVARVAAMMRFGEGVIGSPSGEFRPETILTWLVVSNSNARDSLVLKVVAEKIGLYQARARS